MRLRKHITIGLSYFMMAAVLGVVLRAMRTIQIPVNYRFLVHTHSHIALLGWVYIALTTLLFGLYLNQQKLDRKYKRIFWFTQITLIGMLISFPIQRKFSTTRPMCVRGIFVPESYQPSIR